MPRLVNEYENLIDNIPTHIRNNLTQRHNSRMKRLKTRRNRVKPLLIRPRVFLSHAWKKDTQGRDTHRRVKKINDLLANSGKVFTWFDENQLEGHIIQSITKGIDTCDLIIVFITRAYIDKCANEQNDNCKLELDYSFERKDASKIIPVIMEQDCLDTKTWNGPVGAYLNKKLYIDFSKDFTNIDELLQQIDRYTVEKIPVLEDSKRD